ncbi:MAG: hypothetical protein JWQ30_2803 [Sediminibacterium sp.]|nr:hypothetical protein [Sediminibacterium sp.]
MLTADNPTNKTARELLQEELDIIENASVEVNGIELKPSQCYFIQTDPPHILFNENCPGSLKERIEELLRRYSI